MDYILQFNRSKTTSEEVLSVANSLKELFPDDKFIIMPDYFSIREFNYEELKFLRDSLDREIRDYERQGYI